MNTRTPLIFRILLAIAVVGIILRAFWIDGTDDAGVSLMESKRSTEVDPLADRSRRPKVAMITPSADSNNDFSFPTQRSELNPSRQWISQAVSASGELLHVHSPVETPAHHQAAIKNTIEITQLPSLNAGPAVAEAKLLQHHPSSGSRPAAGDKFSPDDQGNPAPLPGKGIDGEWLADIRIGNKSNSLSAANSSKTKQQLIVNDFQVRPEASSNLPRIQTNQFVTAEAAEPIDNDFSIEPIPVASMAERTVVPAVNRDDANHADFAQAVFAAPRAKRPTGGTTNEGAATDRATNGGTANPSALASAEGFVLAAQPQLGEHWHDVPPLTDRCAQLTETIKEDFSPDATADCLPYDPYHQMQVYEGKTLYANQRPLLELGRPWYQLGQLSPGSTIFGKHNSASPQFLIYGDVRTAIASNSQQGSNVTQSASELNLDFDLKVTETERFHMFMSPLDDGTTNTGYLFDDNRFVSKFDANIDFGYFEGDLGAIAGGLTNQTLPFDFPFAVGVMPLLFQNGVWLEDAFLGVAATIPARNSARFDISNMDTTFFAGYDKITSPAFGADDSAARMYGMASFIEALNGYIEIDYAFLDDRTFDDRSYHNIGLGYTRRYGRLLSNSTRLIFNAGQSTDVVANTADGFLLLSENSLITGSPSTVVPYLNLFAGFDRPQSAARAVQAGGILRNTGILFETDGMTNYPTLDPTANNTLGGAAGLNLIPNLSQQLVVEAAWLNVMGEALNRNAAGNQYGVGVRYQLPLSNALIFRADAMVGFLDDASDIHGMRMELRHKY